MKPEDFWNSTFAEIKLEIDGFWFRQQLTDDFQAHQTALLMSVHIEKKSDRPEPKKLKMLPPRDKQKGERTPEQQKEAFKALKEFRKAQNKAS